MTILNYEWVKRMTSFGRNDGAPTDYHVHKQPAGGARPKVSIILLDWSCRESFHAFEWLERQDVPRDQYELIWIELHDRVAPEAMQHADVVVTLGQKGMYHKHIGYNVGLLLARGDIVTVCDSDAVFPPDFVRSVTTSFRDPETDGLRPLVLMHHELRTSYTYPESLESTDELKDQARWIWWDIIPNAGACVSVRRDDAIRFGGFDECSSYRGYLCGPYDLGWRLVNAGIPEIWHDLSTVLWHFAHPDPIGTNGQKPSLRRLFENTFPHVDLHALTAVEHFSAGRMLPLRENPQIHSLRMQRRQIGTEFERKYSDMTGPRGFNRTVRLALHTLMVVDRVLIIAGRLLVALTKRLQVWLLPILGKKIIDRWKRWIEVRNSPHPMLVEEHPHYNIILYRKWYYGLPKSL
ncbi:MAG TPA: glycosyltransferase family 2 protein, partial [Planctomycetaceae bacterium]